MESAQTASPAVGSTGRLAAAPTYPSDVGRFLTVPNAVTVVRTLGSVVIGVIAVSRGDLALIAVAYGVFWVGDVLDGFLARRLDQETRLGAVLDIVTDRACASVLIVGLVAHEPDAWPVALVYIVNFMALDAMLSLAFLAWPLVSPNYFYRVDKLTYDLNWSPPAKAVNSAFVVVAVAVGWYVVALVIASVVLVVKLWTAVRIARLLGAGAARA